MQCTTMQDLEHVESLLIASGAQAPFLEPVNESVLDGNTFEIVHQNLV